MFEFLRVHQLNIMMVLAGVCLFMSAFILVSRTISRKRKAQLFLLGISAMFLLIFDRHAYEYRGVLTSVGYVMVRLCNFMVYTLTLFIVWIFNEYLDDLLIQFADIPKKTRSFFIIRSLLIVHGIMISATKSA